MRARSRLDRRHRRRHRGRAPRDRGDRAPRQEGQTVAAGDYAQTVCGAVGTWRGEMKSIVREIRIPPSIGDLNDEEPQSETPQGRTGLIRSGLQESVRATKTLVDGDRGRRERPDTPQGNAAASQVSDWADSSRDALEKADDSLGTSRTRSRTPSRQLTGAAGAIRTTLASGKTDARRRRTPRSATRGGIQELEHLSTATARRRPQS